MSDEIWRRDEIESPCVKICVIEPETRLCLGCHRSIDEIGAWSAMTPEARRAVIAELPARAARAKPVRRGGAAGRRSR
ncbi:hypothetical protein HNP73_000553 [Amaricoccus macauensis]|uniref:DUF1289 domain-containing protein n=1 Tax=Amaricoccus macauensis TaxID=57001 RepID=A0A840SMR9_9RHOB|nr:DUF1289 domain-containing protein [Amaricoccus macauensis]MBB5220632.1 hypothetical protein [Amaricoccus macauensis]